ncbi:MAG: DUF4395 family protein [Candidatus Marinimicrobia bacterium]|nr:DUF4395 family protein [Candidatus Neomarinimicrobiota bacterium]
MPKNEGYIMATRVENNFLKQQGYEEQDQKKIWFNSLQFQPTIVSSLILVGIVLQSPTLFLIISAVLWINVLIPSANPFENFYNKYIAPQSDKNRVPPAPGPRRFAQAMAAVFTLVSGVGLLTGLTTLAYVMQGLLVIAFGALIFGKFCLGSYIYHLLQGKTSFANGTCPWS